MPFKRSGKALLFVVFVEIAVSGIGIISGPCQPAGVL
jgi:hypothetical protein